MCGRSRDPLPATVNVPLVLRVVMCLGAIGGGAAAAGPPNIVILLVDDLGVGDVGFSGGTDVPTPQLDRLAREGSVCTQAYATPSCSPTRAALLTGRYPSRYGIEDNRPLDGPTAALDLREVMLPQLLSRHGYRTALFGKWHLGRGDYGPRARGFDEFCGWIGASGKYIDPLLIEDDAPAEQQGWVDDILAAKAAAFIRHHATEPFFLHVAFMAAHLKQEATETDLARFAHLDGRRRMAAAIISRLDRAVGRVLDAIREAALDEQTLVFFLSDNGGEPPVLGTSNGPHRGQKFDVLEGGIRIPMAVRWPGVVPAGGRFSPPVHCMDVFATAAAAAGVASPAPAIDGVDLLPFLRGETRGEPHSRLFWIYNAHADWRRRDQDTNRARRLSAVREGRWKLILSAGQPDTLYDLDTDAGEQCDLAAVHPDRVAAMKAAFEAWYADMTPQVIADDHPIYGRQRSVQP